MRQKYIKILAMLFTSDGTMDSSFSLFLLSTFLYFQWAHFHIIILKFLYFFFLLSCILNGHIFTL